VTLGPVIVRGNRFEVLVNGDKVFPLMMSGVRGRSQKSCGDAPPGCWDHSLIECDPDDGRL